MKVFVIGDGEEQQDKKKVINLMKSMNLIKIKIYSKTKMSKLNFQSCNKRIFINKTILTQNNHFKLNQIQKKLVLNYKKILFHSNKKKNNYVSNKN